MLLALSRGTEGFALTQHNREKQKVYRMLSSRVLPIALLACAVACTSLQVRPVDRQKHPLQGVCIQENPLVIIPEFPQILESAFLKRGIATVVYGRRAPESCEYHLTYTARQSWDLVRYMSRAEVRIARDHVTVASATYSHAGGFGLNKYASPESKMERLMDQLLEGF